MLPNQQFRWNVLATIHVFEPSAFMLLCSVLPQQSFSPRLFVLRQGLTMWPSWPGPKTFNSTSLASHMLILKACTYLEVMLRCLKTPALFWIPTIHAPGYNYRLILALFWAPARVLGSDSQYSLLWPQKLCISPISLHYKVECIKQIITI